MNDTSGPLASETISVIEKHLLRKIHLNADRFIKRWEKHDETTLRFI